MSELGQGCEDEEERSGEEMEDEGQEGEEVTNDGDDAEDEAPRVSLRKKRRSAPSAPARPKRQQTKNARQSWDETTIHEEAKIVTLTLADLKRAAKQKGSVSGSQKQRILIRIASRIEREKVYAKTAEAIGSRESQALPSHGARSWRCQVKITERAPMSSSLKGRGCLYGPLFRWFRGDLELACLPHILEKVPPLEEIVPRCANDDDSDDESILIPRTALQAREASSLSIQAWNDPEYPAPQVDRTWISPDLATFRSRRAAIEHATELVRRDKLIDKVLHGLGSRGVLLRPVKPTKKEALEAGYYRFLRDGLWVVGQEEDWITERLGIWEKRNRRDEKAVAEGKSDKRNVQINRKRNSDKQEFTTAGPKGTGEKVSLVEWSGDQASVPVNNGNQKSERIMQRSVSPSDSEIESSSDEEKRWSTQPQRLVATRRSQQLRVAPSFHWRLNSDQIRLCFDAAMNHFEQVMYTVKARALFAELADGFDVLRERGSGRYDMELEAFDDARFDFLTSLQKAAWMPVVRKILGDDATLVHKGVFLSLSGSSAQVYHQDGPHLTTKYHRPCHAVNVFIPLVDLEPRNGPTEFCLGTHMLGYEGFAREMVDTPCAPAGTPIIFDYRLGHRGLANTSDGCRPVVYLTYCSASKEFRDSVNFSRRRYHRIGTLLDKPPSRAERASRRSRDA